MGAGQDRKRDKTRPSNSQVLWLPLSTTAIVTGHWSHKATDALQTLPPPTSSPPTAFAVSHHRTSRTTRKQNCTSLPSHWALLNIHTYCPPMLFASSRSDLKQPSGRQANTRFFLALPCLAWP